MLETSPKTNLLEQKTYRYSLQDVAEPNLYRDIWGVLVDMVCHKDNLRIVHVRLVKNL